MRKQTRTNCTSISPQGEKCALELGHTGRHSALVESPLACQQSEPVRECDIEGNILAADAQAAEGGGTCPERILCSRCWRDAKIERLTAELAAARKLLTDFAAAVRLSRANPLPDLSTHPRFAEWQQHAGGLCFTDWLVLNTVAAAEAIAADHERDAT